MWYAMSGCSYRAVVTVDICSAGRSSLLVIRVFRATRPNTTLRFKRRCGSEQLFETLGMARAKEEKREATRKIGSDLRKPQKLGSPRDEPAHKPKPQVRPAKAADERQAAIVMFGEDGPGIGLTRHCHHCSTLIPRVAQSSLLPKRVVPPSSILRSVVCLNCTLRSAKLIT
jgi:hypothetical protein